MAEISEYQLDRWARILETGPLVLGEVHTKKTAREAIQRLMAKKSAKFLSLESPVGPELMTRSDGRIKPEYVEKYLAHAPSMNSELSLADLVRFAMACRVPVYFHDIPLKSNPLNRVATLTEGDDTSLYPKYASAFLPPSIKALPMREKTAGDLYVQRNHYSANYLQAKLGNGVRILQGLVILAGSYHLSQQQCGNRYEYTLHGRLGISRDRAFICD